MVELVKEDIRRISNWGYELIKHDFSTWDMFGIWGRETQAWMGGKAWGEPDWSFADRSRTSAEIVVDVYKAIKEAAGNTLILGCTELSLLKWQEIYNQKMAAVPNASYMDDTRARELLNEKSGYMIYRQDVLIGIGKASGNTIHAVASVLPGAGQDALCALAQKLQTQEAELLVATENKRAMALYQRLGFTISEEVSCWYKIL